MAEEKQGNVRQIKSYVWHGDQCFFVSTIERDSSVELAPGRYSETMVWRWDWDTQTRGELIWQDEDLSGTIRTHINICSDLYHDGFDEHDEQGEVK